MTRRTNARLAGAMLLLYIATGIISMIVFRNAAGGETVAAQLASMTRNEGWCG